MSGIVGVLRLDGRPVRTETVQRMAERIAYRGPDGRHAWAEGPAGMGHAMMHTTPESFSESLPLTAGPFTITADARIDNRDTLIPQLRSDLSALGLDREVVPDSSVVLAAYARWGEACAEHLIGDFTVAVWDRREHRLFCARDHLGVRQLYTCHRPGELFAFATEPKALFELDEIVPELDEDRVAESLSARLYEPVGTTFRGIVKLAAGHTVTVGEGRATTRRYWQLEPSSAPPPSNYVEGFAEVFEEAVRCRTRSAVTVGSELSGGLDSSAVTVVAARLMRDVDGAGGLPLHTISLAYEDPRSDERQFVQTVLDQYGDALVPHYVYPEREKIISLYSEIYQTLDNVRVRGNGYINYLTAREAGRNGVRVLLTGQDGDTSVGHGWEWFSEQALAGNWADIREAAEQAYARVREDQDLYHSQLAYEKPSEIASAYVNPVLIWWAEEKRLLKFARASLGIRRHFGAPALGPLKRYWKYMLLPASRREALALRAAEAIARQRMPRVIDPDFAKRSRLQERLAEDVAAVNRAKRGLLAAHELQLYFLRTQWVEGNLNKQDLYPAASGVESRHPFMDIRLIEYCLTVPSGEKLRDGWSRAIMRDALGPALPETVRRRMNKMHYGTHQHNFIFESETDRVEALLADPGEAAHYLDMDVVNALWEKGRRNDPPLDEWEEAGFSAAITLILWFKTSAVAPSRQTTPAITGPPGVGEA